MQTYLDVPHVNLTLQMAIQTLCSFWTVVKIETELVGATKPIHFETLWQAPDWLHCHVFMVKHHSSECAWLVTMGVKASKLHQPDRIGIAFIAFTAYFMFPWSPVGVNFHFSSHIGPMCTTIFSEKDG